MSRFSFQRDTGEEAGGGAGLVPLEATERALALVVRGTGLILLIVGLSVALKVIGEAWSLYRDPATIEALARAIEQGSNLDAALAPERAGEPGAGEEPFAGPPADSAAGPAARFRLTYFIAWAVALLLLLLVGHLALAAVRTGGQLALHDLQLRTLARSLRESVK